MDNLGLLFWMSAILILSVRSEADTDYTKICEECNGHTLPECSTLDAAYNLTIYCEQSEHNACSIGVVQAAAEANEKDTFCLINMSNGASDMPELDDGIKVISIVRGPLSTMKPIALALQMATSEATVTDAAIEVQSMSEVTSEQTTEKPSQAIEHEEHTQQSMTAQVENAVDAVELQMAPQHMESVDYQADAPDTISVAEVPDNNVLEETKTTHSVDVAATEASETAKEPETVNEPEMETVEMKPTASNAIPNETANELVPVVEAPTGAVEFNINTDPIANSSVKTLKCFGCVSTSDVNCTTKPSTEINCRALESAKNGCYTLLKGKGIQRGCASELPQQDLTSCLANGNGSCMLCDSSSCNGAAWPQCYSCRSSRAEPLCAWGMQTAAAAHMATLCARYDDVCVSYIAGAGDTVRACASTFARTCTAQSYTCRNCSSALCNGGVFPAERRRCHQCAGDAECALRQMPAEALACPLYLPNDGCYWYANATGQMLRGCTSSAPQFELCQRSGARRCRSCTQADACNSMPLFVRPTLSCSHCDSRRSEQNSSLSCAWAQSTESVRACSSEYLYYLEESCQLIYQLDVAVRGCSMDMGACEPKADWCRTCSSNACNTDNLKWQYCVQCSSEDTPSCATDAAALEPQKCAGIVQPYELRGCYTWRQVDGNITTRGCISDLTQEGMNYCKAHRKLCTLCHDESCNRQALSSATFLDCQPMLLSLCLALAALLRKAL